MLITCGERGGLTRKGNGCRRPAVNDGPCALHRPLDDPLHAEGVGRPRTELTDEQIDQVERLAGVLQLSEVCYVLDIPERTFSEIKNRDERVSAAYKRGRARLKARAGTTLLQLALGNEAEERPPDRASLFFMLKTQFGYRETSRHELTGEDGGPIQHEDVAGSRERLFGELARIAERRGIIAASGNGRRRVQSTS